MVRRVGLVALLFVLGFPLSAWCQAPPANETRVFTVFVDGKPAGEYRMTVRQEGDTTTMTGVADVKISKYLVYTYVYNYRGTEVWKGERLMRFESATVDDKKHFNVTAWADAGKLKVRANGQERVTQPDVWTTTYWRLPAGKFRNQAVALLDADTGKDLNGTLRFSGMEAIRVTGRPMQCAHWRVTGGVLVDLWYDGNERLVRQESVEDGHKTVLELARVGP
jgi:hypothetical protein